MAAMAAQPGTGLAVQPGTGWDPSNPLGCHEVSPALLLEALAARGAPPAPAPAPTSAPAAACGQCGGRLTRSASDLEHICTGCGLIVEGDSAEPGADEARPAPSSGRLRLVGPNSSQFQPDLFRSGAADSPDVRIGAILKEYRTFRDYFIATGGAAIPINVCARAAEYYSRVQAHCVKRAQNKKTIMAACLRLAGHELDLSYRDSTIADFMQLDCGIARGENFIRGLVADGVMHLDMDIDTCKSEVATLFARLELEGPAYDHLRRAAQKIVQTAIDRKIGINSAIRSKAAGATYAVLKRCTDRALLPTPIDYAKLCAAGNIRHGTVERFVREITGYASHFKECFAEAGLAG